MFMLALILPKRIIRDAQGISAEDIACAKHDTFNILDNPFERILIIETSVDKKEGNALFTSAYTLAGIKYATVELHCNASASVTWRRWFSGK